MNFEIKHWVSGKVLFSLETENMKLCLEAAVKSGADLRGADLRGADLSGADLRDANLSGAHLRGAYGEPIKHATPEESVANLDKVREIIIDKDRFLGAMQKAGLDAASISLLPSAAYQRALDWIARAAAK